MKNILSPEDLCKKASIEDIPALLVILRRQGVGPETYALPFQVVDVISRIGKPEHASELVSFAREIRNNGDYYFQGEDGAKRRNLRLQRLMHCIGRAAAACRKRAKTGISEAKPAPNMLWPAAGD